MTTDLSNFFKQKTIVAKRYLNPAVSKLQTFRKSAQNIGLNNKSHGGVV